MIALVTLQKDWLYQSSFAQLINIFFKFLEIVDEPNFKLKKQYYWTTINACWMYWVTLITFGALISLKDCPICQIEGEFAPLTNWIYF